MPLNNSFTDYGIHLSAADAYVCSHNSQNLAGQVVGIGSAGVAGLDLDRDIARLIHGVTPNFSVPFSLRHLANLTSPRLSILPSQDHEDAFFGVRSTGTGTEKRVLQNIYHNARQMYHADGAAEILKPSPEARERTKKAATEFYRVAHKTLNGNAFPLCGKNKCIGFVSIPNSRLVLVAISEDREPEKDRQVRATMTDLIELMNGQEDNNYIFQLTSLPNQEEYLIFRGLSTPLTHAPDLNYINPKDMIKHQVRHAADIADTVVNGSFDAGQYDKCGKSSTESKWSSTSFNTLRSSCSSAFDTDDNANVDLIEGEKLQQGIPLSLIEYRTRCVEVSLMVGLNKIGRFKQLDPKQISMEAFSCGLWTIQVTKANIRDPSTDYNSAAFSSAIEGFSAKRNAKYTIEPSLKVDLAHHKSAYIDYWGPCNLHCQQLLQNMRAVSVCGGKDGSFVGVMFEHRLKMTSFESRFLPSCPINPRSKDEVDAYDAKLLKRL